MIVIPGRAEGAKPGIQSWIPALARYARSAGMTEE
jgi:hypothetical protein